MSTWPNALRVSSTRRCRSSLDEILAGTAMAEPGCAALIAPATSSQALALREEIVTLAPCSTIRSAIALPMPLVAPVMIATLPVRSNSAGMPVFGRSSVVTDIVGAPLNARLSWLMLVDGQAPRSSAGAWHGWAIGGGQAARYKPRLN